MKKENMQFVRGSFGYAFKNKKCAELFREKCYEMLKVLDNDFPKHEGNTGYTEWSLNVYKGENYAKNSKRK